MSTSRLDYPSAARLLDAGGMVSLEEARLAYTALQEILGSFNGLDDDVLIFRSQDPELPERVALHVAALSSYLTQKPPRVVSDPNNWDQRDEAKKVFSDFDTVEFYLNDGGYSRLLLSLFPLSEGGPRIVLGSVSRSEVVERWRALLSPQKGSSARKRREKPLFSEDERYRVLMALGVLKGVIERPRGDEGFCHGTAAEFKTGEKKAAELGWVILSEPGRFDSPALTSEGERAYRELGLSLLRASWCTFWGPWFNENESRIHAFLYPAGSRAITLVRPKRPKSDPTRSGRPGPWYAVRSYAEVLEIAQTRLFASPEKPLVLYAEPEHALGALERLRKTLDRTWGPDLDWVAHEVQQGMKPFDDVGVNEIVERVVPVLLRVSDPVGVRTATASVPPSHKRRDPRESTEADLYETRHPLKPDSLFYWSPFRVRWSPVVELDKRAEPARIAILAERPGDPTTRIVANTIEDEERISFRPRRDDDRAWKVR